MANCNALSKKARKLTKTELESVLSYADFLISKHKNARHEAHYIIDAKELNSPHCRLGRGAGGSARAFIKFDELKSARYNMAKYRLGGIMRTDNVSEIARAARKLRDDQYPFVIDYIEKLEAKNMERDDWLG